MIPGHVDRLLRAIERCAVTAQNANMICRAASLRMRYCGLDMAEFDAVYPGLYPDKASDQP